MFDLEVSGLSSHPLRSAVLEEIHARPFAEISPPCRLLHFVFLSDQGEQDRIALDRWVTERLGIAGPREGARHFQARTDGRIIQWERHGEFIAYTFELPPGTTPGWLQGLAQPGPLIVAVKLDMNDREGAASALEGTVRASIAHGRALAGSKFRPDPDGYVPIQVIDQGLNPGEAGPLAQRILEVETYRTLALLGFPEAQRQTPTLRRIETELPHLIETMKAGGDVGQSQTLLDRLSELSADLEAASAASAYRFGATRAYADLMRVRLASLGETASEEGPSWEAFFARRLNPALRTCASVEDRQAALSRKLTRAAQLLRTRVEVGLQMQNRDLLTAMNRRAQLQLRLQHTVEGLSVAAISYYLASLLHLVVEGAHVAWPRFDPTIVTASMVPLVVLVVWRTVARIRGAHADSD